MSGLAVIAVLCRPKSPGQRFATCVGCARRPTGARADGDPAVRRLPLARLKRILRELGVSWGKPSSPLSSDPGTYQRRSFDLEAN